MLILLGCFSLSSCKVNSFGISNFQDVNFKEPQKVQLVTEDAVYNVSVSFNEYGEFTLCFLEEVPIGLENLKINIKNDICNIENDDIIYTKNIDDFNNDFFPKLIYEFFRTTDFKNDEYVFNETEKSAFIERNVLEKKLVFTIQLSLDNDTQIYKIELR